MHTVDKVKHAVMEHGQLELDVRARAMEAGQGHIFNDWSSLTREQQAELIQDTKVLPAS